MRHHRLLETYLVEHLGVPWDRVHEEAEALEHVLSRVPRGANRRQARPPDPRPARRPDPVGGSGHRRVRDGLPLRSRRRGDRGVFVRVSDSDPAMLRYLDERGVALGDALEVLERQPFDGPLTVRFGESCMFSAARSPARCGSSSVRNGHPAAASPAAEVRTQLRQRVTASRPRARGSGPLATRETAGRSHPSRLVPPAPLADTPWGYHHARHHTPGRYNSPRTVRR